MIHRFSRGFSLIELLVVLVILGILSIVGVYMIGDRRSTAVRSVMDELEGTIAAAHKRSVATGRDVNLVVKGSWSAADPFELAYGETTAANGTAVTNATILANGLQAPESFQYHPRDRDHMYAGVVVTGSNWWDTAKTGTQDITSLSTFQDPALGFCTSSGSSTTSVISSPSSDACNLSKMQAVGISGYSKRYTATFYIAVVSLRDGQPTQAGPMGVLIVQGNGATIYKFYNPGVANGNGKWRRL